MKIVVPNLSQTARAHFRNHSLAGRFIRWGVCDKNCDSQTPSVGQGRDSNVVGRRRDSALSSSLVRDDRPGRQQTFQTLRTRRRFGQVFQQQCLTRFRKPLPFLQRAPAIEDQASAVLLTSRYCIRVGSL